MNATQLIQLLVEKNLRVFTAADMVTLTKLRKDAATQALRRLQGSGIVGRVKRGVWISRLVKDILPGEVLAYLTAPWPSYVSLESALSEWGIISQIPPLLHAVTAGKPQRIQTPFGSFRIHHLQPRFFGGNIQKQVGSRWYSIATPEKAVLDTLYLRYRLGGTPNFREWNLTPLDRKKLRSLSHTYPRKVQELVLMIG